jgi:hypothetical protein
MRLYQAKYNENHVLVLAQMHNFKAGVIFLYERANMYNEILEYHMERNEYQDILFACKRHGYALHGCTISSAQQLAVSHRVSCMQ